MHATENFTEEGMGKFELILKFSFDAAHYLPVYVGKCRDMHGHTWKVEIVIQGEQDLSIGMVYDSKELKNLIEPYLPDHQLLNNKILNPTAENLAIHLYEVLEYVFKSEELPIKIKEVTVWENEDFGARYSKATD